ncbi:hypothetical protein COLO4_13677 [Corchorus olitorius]|uniref:Uncharacterized protein n=1 Tax=Corchorus olitorius TaxID=93759 RepID=A0A1R3JVK2_9ROSI|nr:hypothetical protein COLO4_13677 [Corchorus olitorius]
MWNSGYLYVGRISGGINGVCVLFGIFVLSLVLKDKPKEKMFSWLKLLMRIKIQCTGSTSLSSEHCNNPKPAPVPLPNLHDPCLCPGAVIAKPNSHQQYFRSPASWVACYN